MSVASPIRGFESGSDHDSEYEIHDHESSLDQSMYHNELNASMMSNDDPTRQLYFTLCDVVDTRMDRLGMKRAIMLCYNDLRDALRHFPMTVEAFKPRSLNATLLSTGIEAHETITATMFEQLLSDIELGKEEEAFGDINKSDMSANGTHLLDSTEQQRTDQNQSALSWVTTDDEGELIYHEDDDENGYEEQSRLYANNQQPQQNQETLQLASPVTSLTNDEEALAKAVVDIVDARLRIGFEERDLAIVAVQSTLTSFAEILKNQEETYEDMMYTERGHPLVPARALTPGPIAPTPPPGKDLKRRTRKRQRRFGPQIFQKPKPVILGMSSNGVASMVDVGTPTHNKRLLLVDTIERPRSRLAAALVVPVASPMGTSAVALAASMTPQELAARKKKNLARNQARAAEIASAGIRVPAYGSVVFPPSDYSRGANADELDPPTADLNVEWVFGYGGSVQKSVNRRGPQPGAELQELQSGEIVFHAGAIVVMFDCTLRTQRFFQGHDDLITAMAVHPGKVIVASGQRGKNHGTICLWDSGAQPAEWSPTKKMDDNEENPKKKVTSEITRLLLPKNNAGISSIDFNEKGELLALVTAVGNGTAGGATLQVWDWRQASMLVSAKAHANPVTMCRFNPFQSHDADEVLEDNRCYTLVTAGLRHVKLWVMKKVEHPLDVEDRYKNKGKKVPKPFGGASRGSYGGETKAEKKEQNLRAEKRAIKDKRPKVWNIKGDVVEAASAAKKKKQNNTKSAGSDMILAICFMPDGSGNGACFAASGDGNIYIYDQLESSEDLPDNVMLRKLNPSTHAKKKLRQERKTAAAAESAANKNGQGTATDASNSTLTLDYVYGFKCDTTQHILHVVGHDSKHLNDARDCDFVFPAAGVGVVQALDINDDFSTSTQSFLCDATANAPEGFRAQNRHTDDIISITVSEQDPSLVATGECGKHPKIIVWSIDGSSKRQHKVLSTLSGFHERGVSQVSFGRVDVSILVSVGMDDSNSVALYNWKTGKLLATLQGGKSPVHRCVFHPYNGRFVTCGVKHIKFWKVSYEGETESSSTEKNDEEKQVNFGGKLGKLGKVGGTTLVKGKPKNNVKCTLVGDNGSFGRMSPPVTMRAIGFIHPEGLGLEKRCDVVTGTDDGTLLTWDMKTNKCTKTTQAHTADGAPSAAINCICSHTKGIVTGGNDGRILLFDHRLTKLYEFHLKRAHVDAFDAILPQVTSISLPYAHNPSKTSRHMLVATKSSEAYYVDLDKAQTQNIVNPIRVQEGHFGGRSEVWGLACHPTKSNIVVSCGDDRCVRSWDISQNQRRVIGRTRVESKARCVGFSPDGEHIAIGMNTGMVEIWDDELETLIRRFHHAEEEVGDVKYSPNGEMLACASRDNRIYLYNVDSGQYKKGKVLKGHSSFCNHIDFSHDSLWLQSNDGAGERLCWSVSTGKISGLGAQAKWSSNTCVFGKDIDGARPPDADKSDLNCSSVSNGGWIVAIGDDDGMVNTTKFPCPKFDEDSDSDDDDEGRTARKRYAAHASHVTNVRFNSNDGYLLSVGGGDRVMMQWQTNFKLDAQALRKKNRKKVKPLCWEPVGWVAMVVKSPHGGTPVTALCHGGREASSNRPRFVSGGGDRTIRLWEQSEGGGGYGMPRQLLKIEFPSPGIGRRAPVPQDIMDVMLSEKFVVGTNDGALVEIDLNYDDNEAKASKEAERFHREHREELEAIFDALDVDMVGTITARHMLKRLTLDYGIRKRLKDYSTSLSNALTPKNVVKALKEIDANKDGVIDVEEFAQFAQHADLLWRERELDEKSKRRRLHGVGRHKTILNGHGRYISAVATHPTRPLFATTGNDRTICVWDIELHCIVAKCGLTAPGVSLAFDKTGTLLACGLLNGIVLVFNVSQKSKKYGTLTTLCQAALVIQRSANYGAAIALPGSKRKPSRREKKITSKSGNGPEAKSPEKKTKKKVDADALSCLNFSPDSTKLAVGSRNGRIYFLKRVSAVADSQKEGKLDQEVQCGFNGIFAAYAVGKGHAAGLTKVDWSKDGTCVRTNADDKFRLYWNSSSGKQDRKALEKRDVDFDTNTCTMQWSTMGIWRPSTAEELMCVDHGNSTVERSLWSQHVQEYDAEEKYKNGKKDSTMNRHVMKKSNKKFKDAKGVKCCNSSRNGKLMVAADDRQRIALWRYPAVEGGQCRLFAGHGNLASDVQFACDDQWVVSVGGDDRAIVIWKHMLEPDGEEAAERKALALQAGAGPKILQDRDTAVTAEEKWAVLDTPEKIKKEPTKEEQWAMLDTPPVSSEKGDTGGNINELALEMGGVVVTGSESGNLVTTKEGGAKETDGAADVVPTTEANASASAPTAPAAIEPELVASPTVVIEAPSTVDAEMHVVAPAAVDNDTSITEEAPVD